MRRYPGVSRSRKVAAAAAGESRAEAAPREKARFLFIFFILFCRAVFDNTIISGPEKSYVPDTRDRKTTSGVGVGVPPDEFSKKNKNDRPKFESARSSETPNDTDPRPPPVDRRPPLAHRSTGRSDRIVEQTLNYRIHSLYTITRNVPTTKRE